MNAIALGLFSKTLEDDRPARDVRVHASAALGIVARPLVLEEPDDDEEHRIERWFPEISFEGAGDPQGLDRLLLWLYRRGVVPVTTRVRRLLGWRPSTHPETEARLEQLRDLEGRRRR